MAKPEKRTKAGTFAKGVSGNPGGRPKGLAAYVREITKDGIELVDLMIGFARDEDTPVKDRQTAIAWLADRGFGKVAQPLTGDDGEGGAAIIVKWGGRGGDSDSPTT